VALFEHPGPHPEADSRHVKVARQDEVNKVYKKGLHSRSVTASLLIKSNWFTEEKAKLVAVLALETR
jgi:hypothetical protein